MRSQLADRDIIDNDREHIAPKLFLIMLCTLFAHLSVFAIHIAQSPEISIGELLPFGIFILFCIVFYWLNRFFGKGGDSRIILISLFLTGVGASLQYRMVATDGSFVVALSIGLTMMLVLWLTLSNHRWEVLEKCAYVAYGIVVLGLLLMLVFGRRYRGGIYLPGNINPTEIVKPLFVLFLAHFLSVNRRIYGGYNFPKMKSFIPLLTFVMVPFILVFILHDLGLLLILGATSIVMLYAATMRKRYLFIGIFSLVISAFVVNHISSHVAQRFLAWQNPFSDVQGAGWQILQGLSAMFAGGMWGAGLGNGAPKTVPIVTSDYIYAAMAEELGFVLCFVILLSYATLISAGFGIAGREKSNFGSLLALGLTWSLAFQTVLNIGGVIKAIPLTGITLPFLSQGGSSLITVLSIMGVLYAMSFPKK